MTNDGSAPVAVKNYVWNKSSPAQLVLNQNLTRESRHGNDESGLEEGPERAFPRHAEGHLFRREKDTRDFA
jgi:hypothetical protein